MNRKMGITALLLCSGLLEAAEGIVEPFYPFSFWGKLSKETTPRMFKVVFFIGYANGFAAAGGSVSSAYGVCVFSSSKIPGLQMIDMIDKYYKDHPEKWSIRIDEAIMNALTVKGSPCEGKTDWRMRKP